MNTKFTAFSITNPLSKYPQSLMPSSGFRLRGAFRSCHACRLRKVRCIYPEGQDSKTCERCRDAAVQCIPAAKATRKSNWRRSVDEAIAQRAPADAPSEQDINPLLADPQALPAYIKPMPESLSASAITYLRQEQAFNLPSEEIRDILLECYFEFYHPSVPLIDPNEFAECIRGNDGSLSLLLFQSILFVGSAFLDASIIRQLGYNTNMEARKVFFNRARVLHECDCEEDRYISAQASLLLSNWYEPMERKESTYWLGSAISAMQTLINSTFTASRANKRLWWSLYIRDRYLTWTTRRPLRLHRGSPHVPELTLEDFGIEKSVFTGSQFLKTPEDQEENARICLELIGLYSALEELILLKSGTQEQRIATDFGGENPPKPAMASFFEHLKWPSRLPANLQFYTGRVRSRGLTVQLSMLHLIYWTSIIESCEVLPAKYRLSTDVLSADVVTTADLTNLAIQNVCGIFQYLKENCLLQGLPLGGVVVLSRSIAPLIRQLEALPSINSFRSARWLAELMDAIQPFRSTYTVADHIFKVFCLGLRQILLRDVTQILHLDKTDIAAWNIDADSPKSTDKLYKNIRLLLLRLDSQDCTPSASENTFYTMHSSSPSLASGSGGSLGSASGSRSDSGHTPDSMHHIKPSHSASSTPGAISIAPIPHHTPSSSLLPHQNEHQIPRNTNGAMSNFLMNTDLVPMEADFDARNLMSTQEFEDFCIHFGFQEHTDMTF